MLGISVSNRKRQFLYAAKIFKKERKDKNMSLLGLKLFSLLKTSVSQK
jgi:hypothetical protein